ncbi:hypothetical protein FOA43_003248 [Brettanomyces nanus]|uniref:Cullin family profile domain-containing protein n=1 Tax=Eeniella nana TaxID=13502 RepID=A0A875SA27_EENNA|nr:uncharacterized protein FOA43_003248 [Brettanomyces nanus]QPG75864.1 hypothetical protein FOA43_003248 [Brettanomyces nanus]
MNSEFDILLDDSNVTQFGFPSFPLSSSSDHSYGYEPSVVNGKRDLVHTNSARPRKRRITDSSEGESSEEVQSRLKYFEGAKALLPQAFEEIIRGKTTSQLQRSLVELQHLCQSMAEDEEFIHSLCLKGNEIFDDELLSSFQDKLISTEDDPMTAFVEMYSDWYLRVQRLQQVFLILDNSRVFRRSYLERPLIAYWMLKFSAGIIESRQRNPADITLFDMEESRTRNNILLGLCDLLKELLQSPPYIFESPKGVIFDRFLTIMQDLRIFHSQVDSSNDTVLIATLSLCFKKAASDLRDNWLSLAAEDYLGHCENAYNQIVIIIDMLGSRLGDKFTHEINLFGESAMSILIKSEQVQTRILTILFPDFLNNHAPCAFLYKVYSVNVWDIVPLVELFCESVSTYLHGWLQEQMLSCQKASKDKSYSIIESLIEYIRSVSAAIEIAFKGEQRFIFHFSTTCEKTVADIDHCDEFIAESLVHYIFGRMSADSSDKTISSQDQELWSYIMKILVMIPDKKRMFLSRYKMLLSRRLLHSSFITPYSNTNDEPACLWREKRLLEMLQENFGVDYTESLNKMIGDLSHSNKVLYQFRRKVHTPVKLSFCCLNSSNWRPPPGNRRVNIPDCLRGIADKYEAMLSQENPVIFDWKFYLHRVTIAITFDVSDPSSCQTVQCSIYQAAILLAFEGIDILDKVSLLTTTGMEENFLDANLKYLTDGSYKVMLQTDNNYMINDSFKCDKKIVKLSTNISSSVQSTTEIPVAVRTGTERDPVEMLTARLRAFMMRTLKNLGPRKHERLTAEVLESLSKDRVDFEEILKNSGRSFTTLIKETVEQLIGEEFIRRDDTDGYKYIP